ncbi:MAG: DUF3862 domain-containing protein [Gammaproteobacteria bacterium]|nr:MAG: DUF3862 domain-containing protein [Gammaproteobacteria bacterium]
MWVRILCVALVMGLVACSKVDQKHYAQLEVGMSYDEVKDILGAPDDCEDMMGGKKCRWGDDKQHIKTTFAGDSLLFFTGKGLK